MVLFDEEVRELARKVRTYPPGGTLFYGSSSMRLWSTLAQDFPDQQPINAGFGGSTLAACAWHFDRIVLPAHPRALILYAGDNDLGEGRQPEEVCLFFQALANKLQHHLPHIPATFLSIKPSPARWGIIGQIRATNALIASTIAQDYPQFQFLEMSALMLTSNGEPDHRLYEADGLHLNALGYVRWQHHLMEHGNALSQAYTPARVQAAELVAV